VRKTDFLVLTLAMIVLMAACRNPSQTAAVPSPTATGAPMATAMTTASSPSATPRTATTAANYPTDKWLGRWQGVEGTYLLLSKNGDKYEVKFTDLDRLYTYEGVAVGDHIEFKRDGKTDSIRATNGKGTGMKYLEREKNCLVITFGSEGFCRK
jgi:hypothetical protein